VAVILGSVWSAFGGRWFITQWLSRDRVHAPDGMELVLYASKMKILEEILLMRLFAMLLKEGGLQASSSQWQQPRVKRVATRPISGGMIAVSRFSCLLLVPSAIESAYHDTKMHFMS
jgi:hypothetical protein